MIDTCLRPILDMRLKRNYINKKIVTVLLQLYILAIYLVYKLLIF